MRRLFLTFIGIGLLFAFNGCSESSTGSNDDDNNNNNNNNGSGNNFSFEDWSGGEPVNWTTSNIPNAYTNVTKSSDAQSGSAAIKAEVLSFQGAPINASITSGTALAPYFEIDQNVSKVNFYYKFSPANTGEYLSVQVSLYSSYPSGILSFETYQIDQAASNYTLLSLDMPIQAETPKLIQISVASIATVGATFLLDNITLE
ncbi:MAG: hypothetical protein D8M58_19770 [Calditrichaeota bacterium]|nr:MAG: hypothetical protein DWQ03_14515 [Calditrichota bacterium]MBL1207648.1 hypothetical protein [Calditrichota bacterium]NOG47481.1 hypothetical protein [Calditrichota bacterium]